VSIDKTGSLGSPFFSVFFLQFPLLLAKQAGNPVAGNAAADASFTNIFFALIKIYSLINMWLHKFVSFGTDSAKTE
jgi:hypothetical protein